MGSYRLSLDAFWVLYRYLRRLLGKGVGTIGRKWGGCLGGLAREKSKSCKWFGCVGDAWKWYGDMFLELFGVVSA